MDNSFMKTQVTEWRIHLKRGSLWGAVHMKSEDLINDELPPYTPPPHTHPALNCKIRLASDSRLI